MTSNIVTREFIRFYSVFGGGAKLRGIIVVLIAAILPIAANQYLSEKPDIKYILSEPISAVDSHNAIVQQLTVTNVGKGQAEKVRVKIDRPVTSYRLEKHFEVDDVSVQNDKTFELTYPILMPSGSFKIIFTSQSTINKGSLSISYSRGIGKDALIETDWFSIPNVVVISYFIFLGLVILFGMKSLSVDAIERHVNRGDVNRVLNRHRPFYISKSRWVELRLDAIKKDVMNPTYSTAISDLRAYSVLTFDKPDYFTDSEWELSKQEASKVLPQRILYSISHNVRYSHEYILNIFRLDKPVHLSDKIWNALREQLSSLYIYLTLMNLGRSGISDALSEQQPNGILEGHWLLREQFLISLCMAGAVKEMLSHPLFQSKDVIDRMTQYGSNLPQENKEQLRSLGRKIALTLEYDSINLNYKTAEAFLNSPKPDWMEQQQYESVKSYADKIVRADADASKYRFYRDLLRDTLRGKRIEETAWDQIPKDDIDSIKELNSGIVQLLERKGEINSLHADVSKLKAKIEAQLNIINSVLKDPDFIYTVEEYSNPFASGNFEALKRLAEILKMHKE